MKTNRVIKIAVTSLLLAFIAAGHPSANVLENNANCSYSKARVKTQEHHQTGELTARIVERLAPTDANSQSANRRLTHPRLFDFECSGFGVQRCCYAQRQGELVFDVANGQPRKHGHFQVA